MGFEVQLQEILYRLPATRQTLLYSATLPKNLVEFAKAGLQNPRLIRLDAESKISNDLQMSFFSVKPAEKEAALLSLLREVIGVPMRDPDAPVSDDEHDEDDDDEPKDRRKGGKRDYKKGGPSKFFKKEKFPQMAPHQTLVFAATKHHVDYLSNLLITAGYAVSHIYGSLDQTARKQQMDRFRRGRTSILVVTDVAARGIDIPVLENVINYDFPTGSRVFVHRVGRVARAGRKGNAFSFVTNTELPFFLDLQLFLGRSLVTSRTAALPDHDASQSMFLGTIPRDSIDADFEYITTSLTEANPALPLMKSVVKKGQAMYERSQGKAAQESYRRSKEMTKDPTWGLAGSIGEEAAVHPSFAASAVNSMNVSSTSGASSSSSKQDQIALAAARASLLASVNSFRPQETIFEIGARGKNNSFQMMQDRRATLNKAIGRKTAQLTSVVPGADKAGEKDHDREEETDEYGMPKEDMEMADEDTLEASPLDALARSRLRSSRTQLTFSHAFACCRPPSRPARSAKRRLLSTTQRPATRTPSSTCRTTSLAPSTTPRDTRCATEPPLPSKPRDPPSTSPATTASSPASRRHRRSPGTARRRSSSRETELEPTTRRSSRPNPEPVCPQHSSPDGSTSGRPRTRSRCLESETPSPRRQRGVTPRGQELAMEGGSGTTRSRRRSLWIRRAIRTRGSSGCRRRRRRTRRLGWQRLGGEAEGLDLEEGERRTRSRTRSGRSIRSGRRGRSRRGSVPFALCVLRILRDRSLTCSCYRFSCGWFGNTEEGEECSGEQGVEGEGEAQAEAVVERSVRVAFWSGILLSFFFCACITFLQADLMAWIRYLEGEGAEGKRG